MLLTNASSYYFVIFNFEICHGSATLLKTANNISTVLITNEKGNFFSKTHTVRNSNSWRYPLIGTGTYFLIKRSRTDSRLTSRCLPVFTEPYWPARSTCCDDWRTPPPQRGESRGRPCLSCSPPAPATPATRDGFVRILGSGSISPALVRAKIIFSYPNKDPVEMRSDLFPLCQNLHQETVLYIRIRIYQSCHMQAL